MVWFLFIVFCFVTVKKILQEKSCPFWTILDKMATCCQIGNIWQHFGNIAFF